MTEDVPMQISKRGQWTLQSGAPRCKPPQMIGDLLFVIDPRPYRAAYDSAVAQLARARAAEQLAQEQEKRAQDAEFAIREGAGSAQPTRRAEGAVARKKADLDAAVEQLNTVDRTAGAAALTTTPLRMIADGETGPVTELAPVLFVAANIVIGLIALGTIRLLLQGRLLPSPAPAR